MSTMHRRSWKRRAGGLVPQIRKKYFFSGKCKIWAFFGQNRAKFANFVKFSGNIIKNSGISIFFSGKNRAFC